MLANFCATAWELSTYSFFTLGSDIRETNLFLSLVGRMPEIVSDTVIMAFFRAFDKPLHCAKHASSCHGCEAEVSLVFVLHRV